jgi:hypothetical protein
MRRVFWCALLAVPLLADGISRDEFKERRAKLQKVAGRRHGAVRHEEGDDLHTGFFQETNFLYLTGWREPGAVMILTKTEEFLLLPPRNCAVRTTRAASWVRTTRTHR